MRGERTGRAALQKKRSNDNKHMKIYLMKMKIKTTIRSK